MLWIDMKFIFYIFANIKTKSYAYKNENNLRIKDQAILDL